MRREVKIDTARLTPRAAEELARLVRQAGSETVTPARSARAPDRFRYTLAVEDGEQKCAWTFDEEQPPEALKPLVEAVRRAAESAAPDSDPEIA
jgi:hypothetical protein